MRLHVVQQDTFTFFNGTWGLNENLPLLENVCDIANKGREEM
jgi:hypothetical protein